jgi:hypothetical protein
MRQFIRYACVGLTLNSIAFLNYLVVAWALGSPKTAVAVLYPITAAIGYRAHGAVSFKASADNLSGLMRYVFAHFSGYASSLFIMHLGVDRFGVRHQYVQIAATLIVAVQLFIVFRIFVFVDAKEHTSSK